MDIVLYPRAAPCDRLRVWIGLFHTTATPALNWLLNGTPVVPVALRQLAGARPAVLLPAGTLPEQVARVFTGVYELPASPRTRSIPLPLRLALTEPRSILARCRQRCRGRNVD